MSSSSATLAKGKPQVGSSSGSSKFEARGKSSAAAAATKRATITTARGRGKAVKKVYSLPGQKFDPPEEREPLRIFYESLSKQIPSSEMAEFWYVSSFPNFPHISDLIASCPNTGDMLTFRVGRIHSAIDFVPIAGALVGNKFWKDTTILQCTLLEHPVNGLTFKIYDRLMEHGLLSPERAKKAYERKQKRQQQVRMGTPIKPSARKDRPESSKKPAALNSMDSKAKKRVDYSDDDDDFIVKFKRSKG
ncbi:hypothetical protein BAE44_0014090 [Dichanthelium oligosanthes]|uniref:Uncharacterized protein n=1 Tax=Dichanthelium oligosanthes TaxID=888268 RepID=A0A1E5VIM2_9POAL|nr:hypothetical protein BAE44_0014090 [Dichanthelium oligosanthes]